MVDKMACVSIRHETTGDRMARTIWWPMVGSVLSLLKARRPTAVARLIVAAVVDALNRMLFSRTWPHVPKELREVEPLFTKRNAATAVTVKMRGLGVGASALHGPPTPILMGFVAAVFCDGVNMKAPAGTVAAVIQICRNRYAYISATAQALPSRFLAPLRGWAQNGKAIKSHISQVKASHLQMISQQKPHVKGIVNHG